MSTDSEIILTMRGLRIEGQADEEWQEIVHGIDIDLRRGEVLGLIGESGAGKSTIGLAAMGYARPGCRLSGGEIMFDGIDLMRASEDEKRCSGSYLALTSRKRLRLGYIASKCSGRMQQSFAR